MRPIDYFERDVLDEVLQWSEDKIYNVFGPRLETIVLTKKTALLQKFRSYWRHRLWFAFKDTGEQFDNETMLLYFDPKKIKKYSLRDMEDFLEKIERETIYSNPKKSSRNDH